MKGGRKIRGCVASSPAVSDWKDVPVHDVVGIGFGPSNIALAVAMRETDYEGKVRFFERASHRSWQHGMMLSGSDIQHNALRDFSTPVDPRGYFTFINYLHVRGKLFRYLNVGLTYAYRAEFAAYVDWVKSHFAPLVEASSIERLEVIPANPPLWQLTTAQGGIHRARIAVVGTGRPRRLPDIPGLAGNDAIIHLTDYLDRIGDVPASAPVVVIGASQSAAEITLDLLRRRFENVHLVHRSFSFQLKDTSPFSDEVYFPEFVDYFHDLSPPDRQQLAQELRRTNYSSVDKDVLDELYRLQYQHSLAGQVPLKIHRNHEIVAIASGETYQRLTIRERYRGSDTNIDFAIAILATGFLDIGIDGREAVPAVLRDVSDRFQWIDDGLRISRHYAVAFAEGENCPPLFLNGLCEATHGLGDAGSFSLVSIRAREILSSIREEMDRLAIAAEKPGRNLS